MLLYELTKPSKMDTSKVKLSFFGHIKIAQSIQKAFPELKVKVELHRTWMWVYFERIDVDSKKIILYPTFSKRK